MGDKMFGKIRGILLSAVTVIAMATFFCGVLVGCAEIPKTSPMARIHSGMSRGDVIDVLDSPGYIQQTSTWRNTFLPWKTKNDYQTVYYYNGLGEIRFNRIGEQTVQSIDYDPLEPGYPTNQ